MPDASERFLWVACGMATRRLKAALQPRGLKYVFLHSIIGLVDSLRTIAFNLALRVTRKRIKTQG